MHLLFLVNSSADDVYHTRGGSQELSKRGGAFFCKHFCLALRVQEFKIKNSEFCPNIILGGGGGDHAFFFRFNGFSWSPKRRASPPPPPPRLSPMAPGPLPDRRGSMARGGGGESPWFWVPTAKLTPGAVAAG